MIEKEYSRERLHRKKKKILTWKKKKKKHFAISDLVRPGIE
jgi:hypothetical protein